MLCADAVHCHPPCSSLSVGCADLQWLTGRIVVNRKRMAAVRPLARLNHDFVRLQELVHEFAAAAHQMLLFTRHVRKVSVLIVEPGQQSAQLLGEVRCCPSGRSSALVLITQRYMGDSASDCIQVFAVACTLDVTPAFNGTATELKITRNVPDDGAESCDKWLKVTS